MDIVDRDMERAEVEATRTWSQSSKERRLSREGSKRSRASVESSSSGSSSSSSVDMNRIQTASAASTARAGVARTRTHPVEMHRTETHRLQQSQTVGASMRTKTDTRPLPEFGGGKPYPPPLPEQDEYVVEFDGKDDPLHPQNWPFKRKQVQ